MMKDKVGDRMHMIGINVSLIDLLEYIPNMKTPNNGPYIKPVVLIKAYRTLSLFTCLNTMIRMNINTVKPKCTLCLNPFRLLSFVSKFSRSTQKEVVKPVSEESAEE